MISQKIVQQELKRKGGVSFAVDDKLILKKLSDMQSVLEDLSTEVDNAKRKAIEKLSGLARYIPDDIKGTPQYKKFNIVMNKQVGMFAKGFGLDIQDARKALWELGNEIKFRK